MNDPVFTQPFIFLPRNLLIGLFLLTYWSGAEAIAPEKDGGTSPPENAAVLARLFSGAVLAAMERHLLPSAPLVIEIQNEDNDDPSLKRWLQQVLEDSSVKNNFIVYKRVGKPLNLNFYVYLGRPEVQITYRSRGRKWLLFSREYEREVRVGFHLQIISPEQKIVYSGQVERDFVDRISPGEVDRVENPELPFTVGTKATSAFINKIVEPVLISGATLTVIYLFYILRSGRR